MKSSEQRIDNVVGCLALVEGMGGSIAVESEEGIGSTIRLWFAWALAPSTATAG
jgi:signal transduction histidine kinase